MDTAYLGLGSNVGDRPAHLSEAIDGLATVDAVRVTATSPVYETEAHTLGADEKQPPFLNAVAEVEVTCSPDELLRTAKRLERQAGRLPDGERWAPRPLDVDLLVVGSVTCHTDTLTLPHPRLGDRRFVLRPWADLAPNLVVPPPFDASISDLLNVCSDTGSVRRMPYALEAPGT